MEFVLAEQEEDRLVYRVQNTYDHEEVFQLSCEPENSVKFLPDTGIMSPGEVSYVICQKNANVKSRIFFNHRNPAIRAKMVSKTSRMRILMTIIMLVCILVYSLRGKYL